MSRHTSKNGLTCWEMMVYAGSWISLPEEKLLYKPVKTQFKEDKTYVKRPTNYMIQIRYRVYKDKGQDDYAIRTVRRLYRIYTCDHSDGTSTEWFVYRGKKIYCTVFDYSEGRGRQVRH